MSIKTTIRKMLQENYPPGAQNDPNAPWNDKRNTSQGEIPKKIKYPVLWSDDNHMAIIKSPQNNLYLFLIDALNPEEYQPYLNSDQEFIGNDEDGNPDFHIDHHDINADVIENYINDNISKLKLGKGIQAYENGNYNLIRITNDLRSYLIKDAKFIKNEKQRNDFINLLRTA